MSQGHGIYAPSPGAGPILQGEILSDLRQFHLTLESVRANQDFSADFKKHPWAIVVSQDCDLEQDFKAREGSGSQDKIIPNSLFCEMMTPGDFITKLKSTGGFPAKIWDSIQQNNHPRYQFLENVPPRLGFHETRAS